MEGEPALCAHSCSTPTLRLCRMTTVSMGGGCWLAVSPKESVASITAFPFSKDGNHPTQIFTSCVSRRALAGNLDLGTAASLNQDDARTLPNTGSISCVTALTSIKLFPKARYIGCQSLNATV